MLSLIGIAAIVLCILLTLIASHGSQSRAESMREAWANIAAGFAVNYIANLLILPLVDLHIGLSDNFWIGCIYTSISLVRQYVIRRSLNDRTLEFIEAKHLTVTFNAEAARWGIVSNTGAYLSSGDTLREAVANHKATL